MRRLQYAVGLPLFLATIYFTYTRSIWLGTGLALLIVAAMSLTGRVRMLVISGAVAASACVWVMFSDAIIFLEREEASGRRAASSAESRETYYYVSWLMFQDKPLWGFGFGQFPSQKVFYLSDRATSLNLEQIRLRPHHSTLLSLLVEVGIIGVVLFLGLLGVWTTHALQIWRDPSAPDWARRLAIVFIGTLASYLVQCLFHDFTYRPVVNSLIFLLAGLVSSVRSQLASASSTTAVPRHEDTGLALPKLALQPE